jgi:hypothetical protein
MSFGGFCILLVTILTYLAYNFHHYGNEKNLNNSILIVKKVMF